MAHLIDKDTLVAEIEKMIPPRAYERETLHSEFVRGQRVAYNEVFSFIDTLEAKDVDLGGEIKSYFKGWGNNEIKCFAMMQDGTSVGVDDCIDIAKHFFELGLKAQKGE